MGKIYIIQNYNANKGDNSVVRTMIDSLNKNNLDLSVSSYNCDKARREYEIPVCEWLISYWDIKMAKSKLKLVIAILNEAAWILYSLIVLLSMRYGLRLWIPKRKKETIRFYKEADVVVLPGGHFFTTLNPLVTNISHYYGLRFAQILGKKTMVYSQTIGPFNGRYSWIVKKLTSRVLKKTTVVTLREPDSLHEYNEPNCTVTAETVFMSPIKIPDANVTLNKSKTTIGVTIHHIYYKYYFTKKEYVAIMADIFNKILGKYDCEIVIIPMEDSYHNGGDRNIASEMIELTTLKESIYILPNDYTPEETAYLISQTDLFIGTKTHSIVYGLKSSVPTISISYQQKSTEFMKSFNMAKYAVNMGELECSKFITIFDELYINMHEIKSELTVKYLQVKESAQQNNKILISLCYEK